MRINQYLLNKGYTPLDEKNGLTLWLKGTIPNKECFYNAFIELDNKTLEIYDCGVNVDAHIKDEKDFQRLVWLYKEFEKIIDCIKNRRTE